MTTIRELAAQQLDAYNAADLDAFAACYHPDVTVYQGEEQQFQGRETLRERYRTMFEEWSFGATVSKRLDMGAHCIDLEHWWRVDPANNKRSEGDLLVRYTMRDNLIGIVQFLKNDD